MEHKYFLNNYIETTINMKLFLSTNVEKSPGESFGLESNPSELGLLRTIPTSVLNPFGIISNKYEKLFVSCLMRNGRRSIRFDPIDSISVQSNNLNQSE